MFLLVVATAIFTSQLPNNLQAETRSSTRGLTGEFPLYRTFWTGMRMKSAFPELRRKMARLLPLRYTDEEPYAPEEESAYGLLGGRVGPAASRSAALSASVGSVGSVWRLLSVLILRSHILTCQPLLSVGSALRSFHF